MCLNNLPESGGYLTIGGIYSQFMHDESKSSIKWLSFSKGIHKDYLTLKLKSISTLHIVMK